MIYLLLYQIVFDILFHPLVCLMYSLTLILRISALLLNLYSRARFVSPKYVVLKSEFSSNLVVSTISDLTPLYLSNYSSCDLLEPSIRFMSSKDSFTFLLLVLLVVLLNFAGFIVME